MMDTREIMTGFNQSLQQIDACYLAIGRKYNLTFNALMFLYLLDECESLSQTEICERLLLPKSTVHSIFLDLQKRSLAAVEQPVQRKEKKICLTPEGRAFFDPILAETAALENHVVQIIGKEKLIELLAQTQRIAGIMEDFLKEGTKND